MKKKEKRYWKEFADNNAKKTFNFVMMGKSRLELAVDMNITKDQLEMMIALSKPFRESLEIAEMVNYNFDLRQLKKKMHNKDVNTQLVKFYFALAHNVGDKPKDEQNTEKLEEFGFNITVRSK